MRPIDADALKEYIDCGHLRNPCEVCFSELDVVNLIDAQPTIDAEPVRHGKFIGTESDGYADGYPVYYEWKCSECGCIFEEEEPTYRFCPQCGARMDKDE